MYRLLFFITIALLYSARLPAQDHMLSLEDCIDIALDHNPSTRAAGFGIQIAEENVGVARAPYYPTLNLNAAYHRFREHFFFPKISTPIPIGIPSFIGPTNDYSYHVSTRYVLYDFGRRRAQLMAAKANRCAALEELARVEQDIILNVSIAYYSLLANQELFDVSKDSLARSEDHQRLAVQRKQAGDTPMSDILKSQVNTANTKQGLFKAESDLRIAYGNLNLAMGLPPESRLTVQPVLSKVLTPNEIDLCDALQQAVYNRPETNAALHKINALRHIIEQAQGDLGPTLTGDAMYGRRDSNYFPHDDEFAFGVTFDFELFSGLGKYHALQKVRAELGQAQAQYDSLVLQVKQDVWNAHARLIEAYQQITTAETQIKDSKESLRHAKERYSAGAGTISDLLDSETAYATSQAMLVDAHWNYRSAFILYQWAQGF